MNWSLKNLLRAVTGLASNGGQPKRGRARLGLENLEERTVPTLSPVSATAGYPFTAIVQVHVTFADGQQAWGSGALIDSDHVLTAAHVLYSYKDGGFATSITVVPEVNGAYEPFGYAIGTYERVESSWIPWNQSNPGLTTTDVNDIGLITLDRPLGNYTGSFGFGTNTDAYFAGAYVQTAGYPGDSNYGFNVYNPVMYYSAGTLVGAYGSDALGFYQNNVTIYEGQSGSPVWQDTSSGNIIYGVISGGNAAEPGNEEMAARITSAVFNDLQSWRSSDAEPTNPVFGAIATQGVLDGTTLSFKVPVTAGNAWQQLTYSLASGAPAGASINASTGQFTWTPSAYEGQRAGSYSVTVNVDVDGSPQEVVSKTFTVEVEGSQQTTSYAALTASASSATVGSPVTFTATVSGYGPPTGTVLVYDGTTYLGSVNLQPSTTNPGYVSQAVFTLPTLGVGAHSISIRYSGDANNLSSSSNPWTLTLNPVVYATTLSLTSNASSVQTGQPVTFTATVNTTFGTPGGTVTFYHNGVSIGTAPLQQVNGVTQASLTVSNLSAGSDAITASYGGDGVHLGSVSQVLTETVTVPPPPPPVPVVAAIGQQIVSEGSVLVVQVAATPGAAGQTLTYSLDAGAPAGATIDPKTGLLTWDPSSVNGQLPGTYTISVDVSVAGAPQLATHQAFTVVVQAVYDAGNGPAAWQLVANGLTHSTEYYVNIVTAAYEKYLGRAPEASGLAYWVNLMQQGLSDESLEAGFIGSPEYIADHGGPGQGWIVGLYQDLLGRTPAASEVAYWMNNLNNGMTPDQVAYGFAASPEREGQIVVADYQQFLGRNPSSSEVSYWVNQFENGMSNETVVAGFVGSQETFQTKGNNNVQDWLFTAYEEILHRAPDATGEAYWMQVLGN